MTLPDDAQMAAIAAIVAAVASVVNNWLSIRNAARQQAMHAENQAALADVKQTMIEIHK